MLKITPAVFILALLCSFSIQAEEAEKEASIAGLWVVTEIEVNGEASEDEDLSRRVCVLTEEGVMAAYESVKAYEVGEADDVGWYELDGEGGISFFEDRNANGKLDEQDKEMADVMKWEMEKESLVLTQTVGEGDEEVTVRYTLKPYEKEDTPERA